jgi:hypothetical protein
VQCKSVRLSSDLILNFNQDDLIISTASLTYSKVAIPVERIIGKRKSAKYCRNGKLVTSPEGIFIFFIPSVVRNVAES